MEHLIATMLGRYEKGSVSRRQLIQGLAALAAAATATPASAQGLQVTGIDHIQINSADALKSSAWYQRVLGLTKIRAGEMSDESPEISHLGVGDTLLLSIRRLKPVGKIDHIGFRLANYNGQAVQKEIAARGEKFQPPDPAAAPGSYLHDPDGVRVQLSGKVATKPY